MLAIKLLGNSTIQHRRGFFQRSCLFVSPPFFSLAIPKRCSVQGARHESMSIYPSTTVGTYRFAIWAAKEIGRVSLLVGWVAAIGGDFVCLEYAPLVYTYTV
jgi:hypothetical protein